MPRRPRIQFEGAVNHLTAHSDQGRDLFRDDVDRRNFALLLARAVHRFRWEILAYCLMGNHYHLLVRLEEPNLSEGIGQLNAEFARRWHARSRTRGHLFQYRFQSRLVQHDSHLLEAARYIVLNPVKDGFCAAPEDWPWSSYRDTVDRRRTPILNPGLLLEMLDEGQGFAAFVSGEDEARVAEAVLGDPAFASRYIGDAIALGVPRRLWRDARPPLSLVLADQTDVAALQRARKAGYTCQEIAAALGCHRSTVSRRLAGSRD